MSEICPRPLHHIGVTVSDMKKAISFYEEVFGYRLFTGPVELTREGDMRGQLENVLGPGFRKLKIAHLSTGTGVGLELFEPIDPPFERQEDDVAYWKSGTTHFCVTDPDIEGMIARIEANGGKQLSEIWDDRPPLGKYFMVYCQDPFGTLIEVHTHSYEIVQGWR
ncbi:MAG: glyoxalase [Hyphomicrobiales bacterium]|nr:glyoxalase [Hyphomicrobiales bacterium]